jgi:hypothetical protein
MINKDSILLWFICSLFILTDCRNNSVTTSTIKNYAFVTKWRVDKVDLYGGGYFTLDANGNIYLIGSERNILKFNSQMLSITK